MKQLLLITSLVIFLLSSITGQDSKGVDSLHVTTYNLGAQQFNDFPHTRILNTYENGLLVKDVTYRYSTEEDGYNPELRSCNSFNTNGHLNGWEYSLYDKENDVWNIFQEVELDVDGSGNWQKYTLNNHATSSFTVVEYILDENGHRIQSDSYQGPSLTSLEPWIRETFEYDNEGNQIFRLRQEVIGKEDFLDNMRWSSEYGPDGITSRFREISYYDQWAPASLSEYGYDEKTSIINELLISDFQDQIKVPQERRTYTNAANGKILSSFVEIFNLIEGEYEPRNVTDYFYSEVSSLNEELLDLELSVFPNPASDIIQVQNESNDRIHVSLFDQNGKLILSQYETGDFTIDIAILPSGNYFLAVSNPTNGAVVTKKVIK